MKVQIQSLFLHSFLDQFLFLKVKMDFSQSNLSPLKSSDRGKDSRREIIWGGSVRECCASFSKTHPLVSSGSAKLSLPEVETLETLRVTETSHKPGGLPLSRLTLRPFHCSPRSQATLRGSTALLSQVEIRGVIVHDPSTKKRRIKE